jgi:hypothetical protein
MKRETSSAASVGMLRSRDDGAAAKLKLSSESASNCANTPPR